MQRLLSHNVSVIYDANFPFKNGRYAKKMAPACASSSSSNERSKGEEEEGKERGREREIGSEALAETEKSQTPQPGIELFLMPML